MNEPAAEAEAARTMQSATTIDKRAQKPSDNKNRRQRAAKPTSNNNGNQ